MDLKKLPKKVETRTCAKQTVNATEIATSGEGRKGSEGGRKRRRTGRVGDEREGERKGWDKGRIGILGKRKEE